MLRSGITLVPSISSGLIQLSKKKLCRITDLLLLSFDFTLISFASILSKLIVYLEIEFFEDSLETKLLPKLNLLSLRTNFVFRSRFSIGLALLKFLWPCRLPKLLQVEGENSFILKKIITLTLCYIRDFRSNNIVSDPNVPLKL